MLREEIVKEWEKCKEKIEELELEVHFYRQSLIITDVNGWQPPNHNQAQILTNLGPPRRIYDKDNTNDSGDSLSYNFRGQTFLAEKMIVLIWGEIFQIEEVD